ncbi:MAG TPA: hypothetical protein VFM18_06765 [Methanosarcina sp.]|nr:hypothetical protein [Methanosarcina sp.]
MSDYGWFALKGITIVAIIDLAVIPNKFRMAFMDIVVNARI